jgi:uncharacterized protein
MKLSPMTTTFGLSLVVNDLERSAAFYSALGYPIAQRCSGRHSLVVSISDGVELVLRTRADFATLTTRELLDTADAIEALVVLTVESRGRVDDLVDLALVSGGGPAGRRVDRTSCYRRGFVDPDGHEFALECSG